mmetsp:Transcript_15421/g.35344  ORF Transcript_15421/g.35344 Transcript_15421/m.35344 type:complete len:147 (+) Transcript_15421:198-638(+)
MASSSSEKVKTGTGNDVVVDACSSGLKRRQRQTHYHQKLVVHKQQEQKQQQQQQQQPPQHKFYGDIVNGLMMGVVTPILAWKIITEIRIDDENSNKEGVGVFDAALMVGATGISALFQCLAWHCDSLLCSRLGYLGNCIAGCYMGA